MIVAKADTGQIIVGLCEADLHDLKAGLTKTKQGNPQYGFRSLIVYLHGKTDQECMALLNTTGAVRTDDLFPNIGAG